MIRARLSKKVELRSEIEPTLPPFLFGDQQQIARIVMNFLSNAIKSVYVLSSFQHRGCHVMSIISQLKSTQLIHS